MLKAETNGLFAPIKGLLYKGVQVFAYIQNTQIFFCNEEKSTLNRDFLNELAPTLGLVYSENKFVFLDEFENNVQINNVFFVDKFGSYFFHESITSFEKVSSSLYIINSSTKSIYEDSEHFNIRTVTYYYDFRKYGSRKDSNYKPCLISGNKEFGKYIGSVNNEYIVCQGENDQYCVIQSSGKSIIESLSIIIVRNKELNTVFSVEDDSVVGYTLENNKVQKYEYRKVWKAFSLLLSNDIEAIDDYMIIYNQEGGYSNAKLAYMIIDSNNEIKSFFYFDLCRLDRITNRGVLVQNFYHDVEQVRNYYDDDPDYCERTVDDGYSLISFEGVYMGAGDNAIISIGNLQNNPGCDKEYDSTPGVYLVDNDVFIETESTYNIIHKGRKGDNFTIIVKNNDGMFGMYFNDKKVLDYCAKKIEVLDYKLSDYREIRPDGDDEQYSGKKSDYFKCITDSDTFIMYDGEIIAKNIRDTKFISIICDGQLIVSDYILITTDESCMLFHGNKFLYELGYEESIKGAYLIKDKAWFRLYNSFEQVGLLYEDILLFSPICTRLVLGFMDDGTPLIGEPYEGLYIGFDKQQFFDDDSKQFLSMCFIYGEPIVNIIAYRQNGECFFVDKDGESVEYEDVEIGDLGLCASFKKDFLHVFSYDEQKFVSNPEATDEEDDDDDYNSYDDEPDYDRDTYYALGGDDYDSFRKNGGSIDNMMDGMGF